MEWFQWASVVGIPSIISGIVALIISRGLAKRDRILEEREIEKNQQTKAIQKENKAITLGIQALLRDSLLRGYKHYLQKGWADYDDRENMEEVWKQYHALGQNGVMDGMRATFLALPLYEGGTSMKTPRGED